MEDFNIYLILTDYSVEQYGYYNSNDFYTYLDELKKKTDDELFDDEILAYVGMNSNEEVIEYYISNKANIDKVRNIIDNGFETENLDEGYSKQGYSWDEVNGMIHIYEDGKLIDKYPDMESAEEAGWDLETLVEDLDEECYNINEAVAPSSSFVELEGFKRDWKDLGLNDEDLRDLQNLIINNPSSSIPLGSNVYKIRFSPERLNRGKDTANRVIYIEVIKSNVIYLATAFSKSEEANISKAAEDTLRAFAKILNK